MSCNSCRNCWIRWIKDRLCITWGDILYCWELSSIVRLVRQECWLCRSIARLIKMMLMFRICPLILGLWKWWSYLLKNRMLKLNKICLLLFLPLLEGRIYRPKGYSLKSRGWNYWLRLIKVLQPDWIIKLMFYGGIYSSMMTIFTALTMIYHTSATLPTYPWKKKLHKTKNTIFHMT